MALEHRLKRQIALEGPITVAAYMTACLHDPEGGYYAARPRLGADGDFITAPMISQMFGELIGLWAAEMWIRLGRPAAFRLVELGPGDGTLMSDAMRALRQVPQVAAAAEVWLVEPSPPLRAQQAAKLSDAGVRWAHRLDEVPDHAPLLLIANEVLDCLPARQFVRIDAGWAERRVGLDAEGEFAFGLAPPPGGFEPPPFAADAPIGAVVELSSAQASLAEEIGARISEDGGVALLIDYGRDAPGLGDTLQAVRGHAKVSPLVRPGEADLTVHADFPAVAAAAIRAGAQTTRVLSQAALLRALGIDQRTAALTAAAEARGRADQAARIGRQRARLGGPGSDGRAVQGAGRSIKRGWPSRASRTGHEHRTSCRQPVVLSGLPAVEPSYGRAPRLLHPRGGRLDGSLRQLERRPGLPRRPRRRDRKPPPRGRPFPRAAGGLAHRLPNPLRHRHRRRDALGATRGPQGDAVATSTPGLICSALAADCAPILLADGEAGVVAAAHAGWKGALGGVAQATVAAMVAKGARASRIVAAVGPCIGPNSYEVGEDFLAAFMAKASEADAFFRAGASADKRLFDLPGFVLDRLARAGVAQAEWIGGDTCADEARFFSNRRAFHRGEGDYGRLISAIVLG